MSENLGDLTGKRALVTGASRGLGQYLALALARAGADLFITAREAARCQATAEQIRKIGGQAQAYSLDVRSQQSIRACAGAIIDGYGGVDILVNNAGLNIRKAALEFSWEEWDTVLDTNLKGQFFVATALAPPMMRNKKGRIINIGSATTVFGMSGIVPYCASRGGVRQMTQALAAEWGPYGITVNCLAPGWFRTEQTQALYENQAWLEYITDRIPNRRPGRPHDLDGAVVFLASDAAEYVNGQLLLVDGGFTTGATRASL